MWNDSHYIELKEIKCPNCGGEIHFEPSMQLSVCIHCGSKFQVIAPRDIREIAPDLITPFQATKEQIRKAFLTWLIEGNYTPNDILTKHVSINIDGIYIPFYLFNDISFRVNWTATSIYYKNVEYQEWDSTTKRRETRYRREEDKQPSYGQVSGSYPSSKIYLATARFLKFKNFVNSKKITADSFKTFNVGYITGFALEPFTIKEMDVYEIEIRGQLEKYIDKKVKAKIQGDSYENVKWDNYNRIISSKKCYYPYWLINYSYNAEKHTVLIDGQIISRIEGTKPTDNDRKNKIPQFFYPLGLFIVALVVILLILQDKQSIDRVKIASVYSGFCAGGFLLIMGLYRRHRLLSHSMSIRKEMLNNMLGGNAANNTAFAEHSSPSLLRMLSEGAIGILLVIIVGVFSYLFVSEPPAMNTQDSVTSEIVGPAITKENETIDKCNNQEGIKNLLSTYFSYLNNKDYSAAYQLLSSKSKNYFSEDDFSKAHESNDFKMSLKEINACRKYNDVFVVQINYIVSGSDTSHAYNIREENGKFKLCWVSAKVKQFSQLFKENNYNKIINQIDKPLIIAPYDADLLAIKGRALRALNRIDDAEKIFRIINETNPKSCEAYFELASIFIKKGDSQKASEYAEKGKIQPDYNKFAVMRLGEKYEMKKISEATPLLQMPDSNSRMIENMKGGDKVLVISTSGDYVGVLLNRGNLRLEANLTADGMDFKELQPTGYIKSNFIVDK